MAYKQRKSRSCSY